MSYHRYVALGDSFTEGVGDPDPDRPNGLRGWADQVAEVLAARTDDFAHANLAIRGRKLDQVIAEQLEPALAMRPDLVTVYAGANDILRPSVDLDALAHRYEEAIGRPRRRRRPGAGVDGVRPGRLRRLPARAGPVRALQRAGPRGRRPPGRGRRRLLAAARLPRLADVGHRPDAHGPAGHRRMAVEVLSVLGVEHDLAALELPEQASATRRQAVAADLDWARSFALPWVQRRLTGRSSGDTVNPRRPPSAP